MKLLKALSLKQPWANMVASGEKTIETRKWPTDYRGPLLIVSSKTPAIPPSGCALAIVTLVDCRPMTSADESAAKCHFYRGAYAWVLRDILRVKPFPVRGQLGIYEVLVPKDGIIFE
jgi:ASCH domain